MRRRRLSPEDRDIWARYTRTTDALDDARRKTVPETPPAEPRSPPAPLRPFDLGERARGKGSTHYAPAPSLRDNLNAAPLRMDAKAHKRMTSGKLRPEG
ncbi:MAG: DNA mismatch repair protein MutS, partial [Pseudomonadota bacterium]